ncbi:MAG: helix-turn-helix domain-containing protein, partial [Acidimicrobiales bacterium]
MARRNAVRRPQRSGSPDIGALLKRARESRGLSLAEVRDRTGIKWEHLEALEATDFASLPDEPTVMTATRRYAEVLHLDASDVCARMLRSWQEANRRAAAAAAAAAATSPSGSSGTGTKPRRRAATFSSRPA